MLYTVKRGSLVTKNYITSFLNFRPTIVQRKLLKNILTEFNNSIARRLNDIQSGFFRDAKVKFNPRKDEYNIYPFELPYNVLIKGNTESNIIGQEIWPGMLSLPGSPFIPRKFQNFNLSENNPIPNTHISLTPLINYKSTDIFTLYKSAFEKKVREIKPILSELKSSTFSFHPFPRILSNYNYSTFYLVLPLSNESHRKLKPLSDELSHLRSELLDEYPNAEQGIYPGEDKERTLLYQPCIHYTLGRMKIPARKDQNLQFGMYETFYMNEVLLKPKSQLVDVFGAGMRYLSKISDGKLSLNTKEVENLKFTPRDLTLSLSGSQLRYNLPG